MNAPASIDFHKTNTMTTETNTTRYFELSAEQKLALDSDGLEIAIQIEALERGIAIPMKLEDAVSQMAYLGFSLPPDAVGFYEIRVPSNYGNTSETGLFFKTEEEALNAIKGAVAIREDGYGDNKRLVFAEGDFTVQKRFVNYRKQKSYSASIKQYEEDLEDYELLCEEAKEDLRTIRQARYDREVNQAKRRRYLELANNNETIAKRFWDNSERIPWPEAEKTEEEAVPA